MAERAVDICLLIPQNKGSNYVLPCCM